jgi:hypothetical protein
MKHGSYFFLGYLNFFTFFFGLDVTAASSVFTGGGAADIGKG